MQADDSHPGTMVPFQMLSAEDENGGKILVSLSNVKLESCLA